MSWHDDLLEIQRRRSTPAPVTRPQIEKPAPVEAEFPELPAFLRRERTPETDERCRRYIEQDKRKPLIDGIAGLFRAHEENERVHRDGAP